MSSTWASASLRKIREGTQAGLAAARQLGRAGGRPPKLTDYDIEAAKALLANPDYRCDANRTLPRRLPGDAVSLHPHSAQSPAWFNGSSRPQAAGDRDGDAPIWPLPEAGHPTGRNQALGRSDEDFVLSNASPPAGRKPTISPPCFRKPSQTQAVGTS
jgi:hypothetical protein